MTIAALLYATGETHAELAAAIGLDQPRVSRRQSGRTAWSLTDLHHLATHYGIHPSDLLRGTDHAVRRLPDHRHAATLAATQPTIATTQETP